MGDVINLRQARKAKRRAEDAAQAAANRARHGRSKAERRLTDSETHRRDAALEGSRREKPDE